MKAGWTATESETQLVFSIYRNPTTEVFSLEELSKFTIVISKFFIYGVFSAIIFHIDNYMGLNVRKPVFGGLQTTKAKTSLCRLISAFVIRLLESMISKLASSEISIF